MFEYYIYSCVYIYIYQYMYIYIYIYMYMGMGMGMGMGKVRTRKWDCHGIRRPRHRGPKGVAPPGGNHFGTTERKRRDKAHCHLGENSRVHDRVLKRDQRGSGEGGARDT